MPANAQYSLKRDQPQRWRRKVLAAPRNATRKCLLEPPNFRTSWASFRWAEASPAQKTLSFCCSRRCNFKHLGIQGLTTPGEQTKGRDTGAAPAKPRHRRGGAVSRGVGTDTPNTREGAGEDLGSHAGGGQLERGLMAQETRGCQERVRVLGKRPVVREPDVGCHGGGGTLTFRGCQAGGATCFTMTKARQKADTKSRTDVQTATS